MSLSIQETANVFRQAGFKEAEVPTMVAVAMGESGLKPDAHNPRYPDNSYGLLQINMLDEPGYQLGAERRAKYGLRSNEDLKDPLTNAKVALDIRNTQGLNAWSVYKEGDYKKHLPKVQQVLGSSSASTSPVAPPPPVDKESSKESSAKKNAEFLKSYIGGGIGATRALAPRTPPKSLDVLGLLQGAFKAPELME